MRIKLSQPFTIIQVSLIHITLKVCYHTYFGVQVLRRMFFNINILRNAEKFRFLFAGDGFAIFQPYVPTLYLLTV